MGQLLLKIPLNMNLEIDIKSVKTTKEILRLANAPKKELKTITLNLPYDLDDVDENEAVGIWADRKDSAEEIARKIREANRKVT
jgi:hypothetical protein